MYNPNIISANLEAMCSSEIATDRSHSTVSVIVLLSVERYSSGLARPTMGMEGSRRQSETPANAIIK